jgi:short-chain 2-methylacyl-CoA dehydrogenase
MDIFCNEEHDLIRQTVRDFAEKEIRPVARDLDEKEEFSVSLTKKMGEIGLFGMVVNERYNGEGFDTLSYIIAVEELARVDSSQAATVAAHNSLGIGPIFNFGSEKQKQKYLPRLTTGESLWGFGLTEPNAGSDSTATRTTAKMEGEEWVINGSKIFITNAATKITLGTTVQARTHDRSGRKNLSTIIVEQDTPGFKAEEMKHKMMWRSSNTAQLFFDNCRVPAENLLGTVGMGSRIMLSTLDSGRLSIAAMGLGLAQGAFEMALKYAGQRKQFGKVIAKFQGISFKLAEMATKIEAARNMLYKACWLKENGRPFAREAAMSKLYCSEIAKEVADDAVQIHGGYGLMKEYDIERFYRDQRLLQIGEGTSEIQKIVIMRHFGLP